MNDDPQFAYPTPATGATPPARPGCPSLPRLAQAAANADWSASEQAHLSTCHSCQILLAYEYRASCPDLLTLARYQVGTTPFAAALRLHLDDDACPSCACRRQSAWVHAAATLLTTGLAAEIALRDLLLGVAEASLQFSPAPSFLPAGSSASALQQVTAAGPDGLIGLTLRQEGPRVVAYVEAPNPALAGRTVSVEVLGRDLRWQVRMILGLVDGVGAFGSQDLGPLSDFLSRIGPHCEILASLER